MRDPRRRLRRGSVFELRDRFGRSVITALARVDGRAVGIRVDRRSGGASAGAADKAARFLRLCDAFGLPVVSLLDCPASWSGRTRSGTACVGPSCAVCGQHAGRYACPRCDVRYCSLACFGKHGECSEQFYAQRRRRFAESPALTRRVGDLLSKGEDDDDARARRASAAAGAARGPRRGDGRGDGPRGGASELGTAPWTPWWAGVGRFDDDVAACEAGRAAVARAGLADAAAADALRGGRRRCEAPRRQRRPRAVLGRSAAAPPLWALVWRDGDGAGAPVEAAARVAGERLARDRASAVGHGALLRDVAALLAAPAVAAAALLDAWSLVVLARGAPKKLRRKARYLALWCGAPLGRNQPQPDFNARPVARACAAARRAVVSAADAAEMDPPRRTTTTRRTSRASRTCASTAARAAPPVVVAAPPAVDYDEPD
ncbi:carboxylase [Aureococcus anophagefferens]|nr:carboxylase [Aureococcus anophagefferens]